MHPVALTIGGSDSGGGAGVQADLKTFSALGVHGTSAITAVTAQNTLGVQKVFGFDPEVVSAQLSSILSDFDVAFAKTGMLYSPEIVEVVAEALKRAEVPLVVDPVIEAEAGGRLFKPEAVEALKRELVPMARVVTPNIFEARALTGISAENLVSAEAAALAISEMGAEAVVVKGGHMGCEGCTDLLLEGERIVLVQGERVKGGNHGIGCSYSAALTAFLARGYSLEEAASRAQSFAASAVQHSLRAGRGVGPVDQTGALREEAERYRVSFDLRRAVDLLQGKERLGLLVPEEGSCIGMAMEGARILGDVASVDLRLRGKEVRAEGCVSFGAPKLVTSLVLASASCSPKARAAMSVSSEALEAFGEKVVRIDLSKDASKIKIRSLGRALGTAFERLEGIPKPQVIWLGEKLGAVLLGKSAVDVALKAVEATEICAH